MSLAIYDKIGDFYGWRQMPKDTTGVFFGFAGCTRDALETALIAMRSSFGNSWITGDKGARDNCIARIAWDISATNGADYNGLVKFLNWAYVAANGESAVNKWFSGGEFTALDYYAGYVVDTITDTATSAGETLKYGIEMKTGVEKALFDKVLPVVGLIGVCYVAKKILD